MESLSPPAITSQQLAQLAAEINRHVEEADKSCQASMLKFHAAGRLLNQAKAYLLAYLTEPDLTPDRLASELGVSRRSLYKAFEQAQEKPQAFLLRARLQRCRELLMGNLGTHRNLADLALSHGFSDAAHFSRTYKKVFGESPSQARQRRPA